MVRRDALARLAAGGKGRLAAPKAPKVASVGPAGVTLRWAAPRKGKAAAYQILRDGRLIGRTTHRTFTDKKARPGRTYRYAVRGVDAHGRRGLLSHSIRVKVPTLKPVAGPPGVPPASGGETPVVAPIQAGPGPAPIVAPLTAAQVERLFWRAGFGPTARQRQDWTGHAHAELVDWFLDTVPTPDQTLPQPLTAANAPIDPLASADDLVTEWVDAMQRVDNPLPERLAFFWHRHWAVSIDDGIPNQWLLTYRDRMRGFTRDRSFRDIAYEMSTADAAMMMYLNGNQNRKNAPNENYAREFMELFCLGPKAPDGTPNYSQGDVAGLALAFTGWTINGTQTDPNYGVVSFNPARFDNANDKTFLGQTIPKLGRAAVAADGPATVARAVDVVLAHPNHAQFLIRKLWAEFIASPIPQATLDELIAAYRGSGFKLRPVIRGILMHPLIFESPGEPNLVKPPIVYLVGLLRAVGAPQKSNYLRVALDNMQQRPYRPPNVAGWEGGLSWLNSNTVQARFDAAVRVQYLKYSNAANGYPGQAPPAIPVESAQATFERAYLAAGSPWLSDGTRAQLMTYANAAPVDTDARRRQRFYTLQALMLGGPDGQVM
jgi:uncharacterized protein (DUF1800 family)